MRTASGKSTFSVRIRKPKASPPSPQPKQCHSCVAGSTLNDGGLLAVEGAAAPEQAALLLEHDALGDERDEVGGVAYAPHVFVGYATHATPSPLSEPRVDESTDAATEPPRCRTILPQARDTPNARVQTRSAERRYTSHFFGTKALELADREAVGHPGDVVDDAPARAPRLVGSDARRGRSSGCSR